MTEDRINRVIEKYEEEINNNKLTGVKCQSCGHVMVPPRPVCRQCRSPDVEIVPIDGRGKLLTWTIIHVGPPSYENQVPYTVGIVELENGERLTGIVDIPATELTYDLPVVADFDAEREGAARLRWKKAVSGQ